MRYEFFSSNFGLATYGQTESNAYKPTVHWHRWAQKQIKPLFKEDKRFGNYGLIIYHEVSLRKHVKAYNFIIYCKTSNVRVHEMFAKSRDSRTFHAREYSTGQELSKNVWHSYVKMAKTALIHLIMVGFSIRNHPWKAEDLSYLKIREHFMHTNCLWPKFATFSCREFFMFYSSSS